MSLYFCPIHNCPIVYESDGKKGKCMYDKCDYTVKSNYNEQTGTMNISMEVTYDIPIDPKHFENEPNS